MTDLECRNELVIRERRGDLSPVEQTALDAHLAHCPSCRLTQRLGADFEECGVLETADGARAARLAELASQWAHTERGAPVRGRARSRSRFALPLVAACTLLVAAGASGAYAVFKATSATAVVVTPPPAEKTPAPKARAISNAAPRVVEVPPPAEAKAAPVAPRPTPASASELLEQANRARRSGSAASALSLFRELTQRYPGSAEARLAEVRLGGLLLERGQARAALVEFDRHLSRGGGLAPEALYGKARAFSALGDTAGESAAWKALLRDYPGSPYVGSAERRLDALNGHSSKTK